MTEMTVAADSVPARVAVIISTGTARNFCAPIFRRWCATPVCHSGCLVADNGSTDGSVDLLKRDFPNVRTILFSENHGFAEGYNLAIKELAPHYKYSVLLNSDVEVKDDWLTPMFNFMESHPRRELFSRKFCH